MGRVCRAQEVKSWRTCFQLATDMVDEMEPKLIGMCSCHHPHHFLSCHMTDEAGNHTAWKMNASELFDLLSPVGKIFHRLAWLLCFLFLALVLWNAVCLYPSCWLLIKGIRRSRSIIFTNSQPISLTQILFLPKSLSSCSGSLIGCMFDLFTLSYMSLICFLHFPFFYSHCTSVCMFYTELSSVSLIVTYTEFNLPLESYI